MVKHSLCPKIIQHSLCIDSSSIKTPLAILDDMLLPAIGKQFSIQDHFAMYVLP